jgi:hypothetical protein
MRTALTVGYWVGSVVVFWWAATSLVKPWQPFPVRAFGWLITIPFVWSFVALVLVRWYVASKRIEEEQHRQRLEQYQMQVREAMWEAEYGSTDDEE